jgi:hypothetical protein
MPRALLFHMVQAEGGRISITGSPPGASVGKRIVMLLGPRGMDRSSAPAETSVFGRVSPPVERCIITPAKHGLVPVRAWQANPVVKSLPQWTAWP